MNPDTKLRTGLVLLALGVVLTAALFVRPTALEGVLAAVVGVLVVLSVAVGALLVGTARRERPAGRQPGRPNA